MLELTLRRIVRRSPPLLLAAVALTALSGCNEREMRELAIVLAVALVLAALVQLAFLTVLIVGIVKLVNRKPSVSWGVAGLVIGAMNGLPSLWTLLTWQLDGFGIVGILFGGALAYVGWRNVTGAREALRGPWSPGQGPHSPPSPASPAPSAAPPAPPPPPPDMPPASPL